MSRESLLTFLAGIVSAGTCSLFIKFSPQNQTKIYSTHCALSRAFLDSFEYDFESFRNIVQMLVWFIEVS